MFEKNYLNKIHSMVNQYLSDLNVLYTKVRNFHYNISGVEFFEVHEKFGEYYAMIQDEMDEVAERILMIEGKPFASLKDYLKHATIKEVDSKDYSYKEVCAQSIKDFESMVKSSHDIIDFASENKDAGTADLFTRTVQNYQKAIWMLKAFNKGFNA